MLNFTKCRDQSKYVCMLASIAIYIYYIYTQNLPGEREGKVIDSLFTSIPIRCVVL